MGTNVINRLSVDLVLLNKVPDPAVRDWYVTQDVQHGCSSAVLSHHITTGRQAADDELIRRGLTSDSDDVHQLR